MPRNRVQHQKGLSDDAFERLYPDEEACRKAWFAWRWPEGFKCPRCAGSKYCEIRGRQLLQCRQCRHQTSLIAGTVLQGTKLPMRVWFRAMHLLAQGKKGLSNIELGRRLGISTNAAWRVQHKLMQAMIERDRCYKLGAARATDRDRRRLYRRRAHRRGFRAWSARPHPLYHGGRNYRRQTAFICPPASRPRVPDRRNQAAMCRGRKYRQRAGNGFLALSTAHPSSDAMTAAPITVILA